MVQNPAKLISTAERFSDEGKHKKAIRAYQKLLRLDPNNLRVQIKLAELYCRSQAFDLAYDAFFEIANTYTDHGQALKAIAIYNQAIQLRPDSPDARISLASTYQRVGLLNDAASQYGKAISLLNGSQHTTLRLHTIRAMLDLDPGNAPMRLRLAEEFSKNGLIDEAATEFERVCDILRERGNKEDFVLVAERLLFHRPTDIDICKELASIYLEQNYPQRALPKLHLCYKSRPRDTEVLTILSSVFEQLHQTHKAVVTLKELARIYEESGLRNERDDALMSVLKLDSGDQEAKAALSSQKPLPKKSQMDSEIIFDEEAFLAKSPAPPVPPSLPTMGASENVSSDQDDEIGFDDSDGEEEVVVQPMSEIDIPISIEEESRELEELPVEFVAPPEMPPIHPEIPLEATAGENDGFSDATLDEPIITAVEEPDDQDPLSDATLDEPIITAVEEPDDQEPLSDATMDEPIVTAIEEPSDQDPLSDATMDEPIITAVEEPEDEIEIPLEEPVSAGTTGSDSLSSPETSPETPPAPPEAPVDAPASSEHVEEAPVAQNAISAIPMGPESTETSVEKTEALDAETVPAPPKLEAEDNEGRQEEETGTQPAKLSEEEEAALQGELQELEFFLEVGLDSEAQSLLNELLTRYPGHPDLVAHSANHQKDGSKGSNS